MKCLKCGCTHLVSIELYPGRDFGDIDNPTTNGFATGYFKSTRAEDLETEYEEFLENLECVYVCFDCGETHVKKHSCEETQRMVK